MESSPRSWSRKVLVNLYIHPWQVKSGIWNLVQDILSAKCLEFYKYGHDKQNNGSEILSKVLIRKGLWKSLNTALASKIMDLESCPRSWSRNPPNWPDSQNIGQSPNFLAHSQNIGQSPKILGDLQKIFQSPKILGNLPKYWSNSQNIGQTPKNWPNSQFFLATWKGP